MGVLRKIAKGFGIFLAVMAILLVLIYLEENWRGARDWAKCQKDLAAKGEVLDLRTLSPPGDAKDDLSKVPIFAEIYREDYPSISSTQRQSMKPARLDAVDLKLGSISSRPYPRLGSYKRGEPVDLNEWQNFYRGTPNAHLSKEKATAAQDVLTALSQCDPEMGEVDAAVSRPDAFFPFSYENPFDSPIAPSTKLLTLAKLLQLRAAARLGNAEADAAEKDFLLSVRLNQPLGRNCFLIDYLVMIADRSIDDGIIWEGIHRHAWNAAQLQEMDSALSSINLLSLGQKTLRFERASMLQTTKILEQPYSQLSKLVASSYGWPAYCLLYGRPTGWWDQDRIHHTLRVQGWIEEIHPDSGTLRKVVELNPADRPAWKRACDLLIRPLSSTAEPANVGVLSKMAEAETSRREARLACRLEEYYLAHKAYPESLFELGDLPAHLNQEVTNDNLLHYQRRGDSYVLYSPGWDGKDRGGIPRKSGSFGDDFDWVWPGP